MATTTSTYDHHDSAVLEPARPKVSWGAIIAAVVIALALQVLFGMLGTAIGASTIDPLKANGSPDAPAFGIGAGIWWVVTSLISMFAGGWIAGHLSGAPRKSDAMLHGLSAWGLATIIMLYLVSSAAGSLVSGAASALGKVASASAQGVAAVAPDVKNAVQQATGDNGFSWDNIKNEAQALLSQTGKPALQPDAIAQDAKNAAQPQPGAAGNGNQDIGAMLDRLFSQGKNAASQVDRDAVINVLVQRTGMSRDEAAKRVATWENTYQQGKAKYEEMKKQAAETARQAADATAKAVSRAALFAFLASLLGALAAMYGATKSASRYQDDAR